MKRNNMIRDSLNENLSGLYVSQQQHADLMNEITGGKKVKTKMKTSLVLAMAMVLLAAVALAVGYNFFYSPDVSAKNAARNAVMEQYGLSREAMDMFWPEVEAGDHGSTVRFTAYDVYGEAFTQMGVYTVTVAKDGSAAAQWTHDGADPATWADGSLDDAVWGNKQILAYREKRDQENKLSHVSAAGNAPADESSTKPVAQQGKLTEAQALDLAQAAMKETFGLSDETLTLFDAYTGLGEQEKGVWVVVYRPTGVSSTLFQTDGASPLGNYVVSISDETAKALNATWSLEKQAKGTYTQETWGQATIYSADMLPLVLDLVNTCAPLLEKGEATGVALSVEDNAAYDQAFRDAGFDATRYNHVLPQEGDISYEQAVEIVAQVLNEQCGVSRAVFDASGFAYADLTQKEDHRTWYFWVQNTEEQCGWTVEFDAGTGEIHYVEADPFANSNG